LAPEDALLGKSLVKQPLTPLTLRQLSSELQTRTAPAAHAKNWPKTVQVAVRPQTVTCLLRLPVCGSSSRWPPGSG